jgi:hypothetical protein
MMEFTEKDYELLAEALGAWESEPGNKDLIALTMTGLLGVAVGKSPPTEKEVDDRRRVADGKIAARKQMTIILRAKIELARQAAQAAAIAAADQPRAEG